MLEQIQKIAAPEEVLESVRASLALLKLEMKAFMDQCKTQNAKKLEWKFVIAQYAALCEKLQPTTDASWGEACERCELDMCTTTTLARLASLFFARSVRISTTTTCFDLNARPSLLVSLLVQRESKTVDMRLQSGRHRTSKKYRINHASGVYEFRLHWPTCPDARYFSFEALNCPKLVADFCIGRPLLRSNIEAKHGALPADARHQLVVFDEQAAVASEERCANKRARTTALRRASCVAKTNTYGSHVNTRLLELWRTEGLEGDPCGPSYHRLYAAARASVDEAHI